MVVERTYTVTVKALEHDSMPLPSDIHLNRTIRDALSKEYPGTTMSVSGSSNDATYGKEDK